MSFYPDFGTTERKGGGGEEGEKRRKVRNLLACAGPTSVQMWVRWVGAKSTAERERERGREREKEREKERSTWVTRLVAKSTAEMLSSCGPKLSNSSVVKSSCAHRHRQTKGDKDTDRHRQPQPEPDTQTKTLTHRHTHH